MRHAILSALGALAAGANAQDPAPPDGIVIDDPAAVWSLTIENDGYFGSDDNYTSGFRLAYLSGNRDLDPLGRFVARRVLRIDAPLGQMRIRRGIALAQEIYTPDTVRAAEPLPDEHPYGAYLYGRITRLIEQPNRVDQLSVDVGVVGPSARGEEAQDFVHSIVGRVKSRGWDNQIGDMPGLNVHYDQQRRLASTGYRGGLGFDVVANAGVSAGTVEVSARLGANMRFGQNLTAGYGPPRVRPATAGSGFFREQGRPAWYLFLGTQVEAVGHNVFLDGSPFAGHDPSVDSNVIVADLQAGAAIQLGRSQLAFSYVRRSEEFRTQDGSQQFGALSLSRRF